jgi:hypothetical protein
MEGVHNGWTAGLHPVRVYSPADVSKLPTAFFFRIEKYGGEERLWEKWRTLYFRG